MAAELTEVTGCNHDSDLVLIAAAVHRIDHRTSQMEAEWRELLGAFTAGGLRGFRTAATLIRGRHG